MPFVGQHFAQPCKEYAIKAFWITILDNSDEMRYTDGWAWYLPRKFPGNKSEINDRPEDPE
jgi:hypothetical protein